MPAISDLLESICKNTIETILLCLTQATKGTIYRIGPMPGLQAVRITSGMREEGTERIKWGLPGSSDYNYPGKSWELYRDQPGRPLEAMGWCVEKQKSWTSDVPNENTRSVRKQLHEEMEDFHHMEPVLVKKQDLYGKGLFSLRHPVDYYGNPIWQDTDCAVVAVIKIHFLPNTIAQGTRSTRILKRLSRTLGTEMLSLRLSEITLKEQRDLAHQRIEGCNVVAHELRNTLMKMNFAFGVVNAEVAFLREQWEKELRRVCPELQDKRALLNRLDELLRSRIPLMDGSEELLALARQLIEEQKELGTLSLLPHQEEQWINDKLEPKWERLVCESHVWAADREEMRELMGNLKTAIWNGMDPDLVQKLSHLPEDIRTRWPKLVYTRFTADKISLLEEIIQMLRHPAMDIPYKQHAGTVFTSLNNFLKIIPEAERRINTVISFLKTGLPQEQDETES